MTICFSEMDEFSLAPAFEKPDLCAAVDAMLHRLDERMLPVVEQYERIAPARLEAEDNIKALGDLLAQIEAIHASLGVFLAILTALRDEAMYLLLSQAEGSVQLREREARALTAPVTRRMEYVRTAMDSLSSQVVSIRRQIDVIARGGAV